MEHRPIITLTTDFGLNDHFVGTIKGVILSIAPEAEIVDISHSVQAFDVLDGALMIAQSYSYFPSGTVHLVVVDPGVGTARRPILVTSDRHHFVAPDNGVLSMVYAREERLHIRHVTAEHYSLQPVSNTFHGRDIFAPIAAWLAKGVDSEKFGDEITDFVRFNPPKPKSVNGNTLRGVILKVDRFGNLVTNITPQDAPMLFAAEPPPSRWWWASTRLPKFCPNYSEGSPGQVFGILGSMGYLEIASNRGSAAKIVGSRQRQRSDDLTRRRSRRRQRKLDSERGGSGRPDPRLLTVGSNLAGQGARATLTLRALRLGMHVALDFSRPFQKAPEVAALPPHEFPEFEEADLLHLDSTIGLDPPQQIGAAPRSKAMSAGRVPEKSKHVAHGYIRV